MNIQFTYDHRILSADLSQPLDISLPIKDGSSNPNCYWAEPVKFETIILGDFVGSVAQGGSVNYQKITLTPHGNGTHTECYGHITPDEHGTISNTLKESHFVAELISLTPEKIGEDEIITFESFVANWPQERRDAAIIRTLPNDESKKLRQYSGQNPSYLDHKITEFLHSQGVEHLVLDLPSVDKEVDGGALKAHRAFWGLPDNTRKGATITELAYINDNIKDGLYLLNMQTLNLEMDASPSRPVLYKIAGI
ncbi:cyclase family protein [Fulvivirga sp. RKSG066]|uniref:cyclase family protein n=1 Tax=Fulvivirga aurantia TaxID=2529383 RepID=UPI0012BD191B|nr:cyclase family protein [Fulvivirga aurantia]MTI21253.1 cyclase family protein [Fulvivirga aurantia]